VLCVYAAEAEHAEAQRRVQKRCSAPPLPAALLRSAAVAPLRVCGLALPASLLILLGSPKCRTNWLKICSNLLGMTNLDVIIRALVDLNT
jgi:hypothetical protein